MAAEEYAGRDEYLTKYLAEINNPNILLIIERTKNKNIVVYEGLVEGGELKADKPVDAYWFDIDPDYIKANRKKGKTDDKVELGMMEASMAYGVSCKPVEGTPGTYHMNLVAFSKKDITVSMVGDRPRARCLVNGVDCYVTWIYCKSVERMIGPAKVVYVLVYGEAVDGSGEQVERVEP